MGTKIATGLVCGAIMALVIYSTPGPAPELRNVGTILAFVIGFVMPLVIRIRPPRLCPYCKGQVNPGATVCVHCGRDLPPEEQDDPK